MIQLRHRQWLLAARGPTYSSLSASLPRAGFVPPPDPECSFSVSLKLRLAAFSGQHTVLDMPGVLRVRLRQHDPRDRTRQNYPVCPLADGSVPVLEATLLLHSAEHPDWQEMTVGAPLGLLARPFGAHEVVASFTGPGWSLYVDGELVDDDFPFGYPRWGAVGGWSLDPAWASAADLYLPALEPRAAAAPPAPAARGVQYWTPPGHNTWVGDVVTVWHQERYHLFYLFDRRHHQSKFGCGAHYFEHLSTADFRTWTEHEAATPLTEQWQCIGTGTPFLRDGRLHLSHGLHTTRVYPRARTMLPAQWAHLEQHGRTGAFRAGTGAGVPAGSTYAVCTDGLARFQPSGVVFHPCENPSVYCDEAGRLRLLANAGASGIWESEELDRGWRCVQPDFPPGGDCTFHFRWGAFDYLVGGFTGFWAKPAEAPDSAYEDLVARGIDPYDGSNVPSVTVIPGGRCVMAAWIPIRGWGGALVLRELIQYPDGRLGARWLEEAVPATGASEPLASRVDGVARFPVGRRAYLLSFVAEPRVPGQGRLALTLMPAGEPAGACELQVRLDTGRAQYGPGSGEGFAVDRPSLREGGAPHQARDYAVERLLGTERPFAVRVVVVRDDKIGGTLVDTEIAGQRTMVSYRPDLAADAISLRTEGVVLRQVGVAPLAG